MKILDPGHRYLIEGLDGGPSQEIYFAKREGPNYPGNVGTHGGPISQEFLRAILHRCIYMNNQGHCAETDVIIANLRTAIMMFEIRAARCRGTAIELNYLADIDVWATCPTCGHIQCDATRHSRPHWSESKPVIVDVCASCNQDKQSNWTYCPSCGAQQTLPKNLVGVTLNKGKL